MRLLAFSVIGAVGFASAASAGPEEDARFLSEQLYSNEIVDTTFATLGPMITDSVVLRFQKAGVTISDPDLFMQIMLAEFQRSFVRNLQAKLVPVLRDRFSDQELAELAAFYHSPTGQRMVAEQPALIRDGSRIGAEAGGKAGLESAAAVAKRADDAGIVLTGPNGKAIDTLTFLRGY